VSTVLALVNDDGHVALIAATRRRRTALAVTALILWQVGVPGWRAAEIDPATAAAAHAGYHDCRTCTMCLACGCPVQLAARGMCPHGGAELIDAASRRLGLT
jgi:hypothetical protein